MSDQKLSMLYNGLNPQSLAHHLAFYELYPTSAQGKKALADAWSLMLGPAQSSAINLPLIQSSEVLKGLMELVNKHPNPSIPYNKSVANDLAPLSQLLPHSILLGHHVWTEEEVLNLPLDQIDLSRALFISQFEGDREKILYYEALIDLMALQIRNCLSNNASANEKIRIINRHVFDEWGFRFPPHSLFHKAIDQYTFLPSVIDARRGVCLGVSILYICLAQRLKLELEMVTPPGHIYVRCRTPEGIINIETTARGIHLDCDHYLDVNTLELQERTIKEVVGLAHFNQASLYLQEERYEEACQTYKKCLPYLRGDPLLKEFYAFTLISTGHEEEGKKLLKEIASHIPSHAVKGSTLPEDFLAGHAPIEGIQSLFVHTEEGREFLLERKSSLVALLQSHPLFKAGWLQLAMLWVKLHRGGEALKALRHYTQLAPNDPEGHFYSALLSMERHDYKAAWTHLKTVEQLLANCGYACKKVKDLRKQLTKQSPEEKS
ncbi:MAG: hypothetical protein LW832_08060 [Parachlamydia sp.]|nr:hypothetical protein [Parachlamydia sp.]